MSATLSDEIQSLQKLILNTPALLELEENEEVEAKLTQYYLRSKEDDKFLYLYVMLKLKLIKGKTIVFVRTPSPSKKYFLIII